MCLRVTRLLLILGVLVLSMVAARPTEGDAQSLKESASPPVATLAAETATKDDTSAPRGKRGIIYQTHGYPGLVYPSLATYPYPYPGYFDLRYPSFAYPGFPSVAAYPGYPLLIG